MLPMPKILDHFWLKCLETVLWRSKEYSTNSLSDRRTDLDRAYVKMVRVVYEEIGRMAQEQQKTPKDVVMFGRITIVYHVYVVQIITINIRTLVLIV